MAFTSKSNARYLKVTTDASNKIRAKAEKLIQKKIDPIYKTLANSEWAIKDSKYLPWALEMVMTPRQAKILHALPDLDRTSEMGKLEVTEKFAGKLGLDKKTVEADIKDLYEKGWIFPTKKGPQGPRGYGQWIDTQNHPKYEKKLGRDYFDLLRLIGEDDAQKNRERRVAEEELVGSRVIPRWKAIKDIPGVLPIEDIREIIKAKEIFAVTECACRKRYPERECDVPEELCIVMDATAKYNIERGAARQLTREQVLEMLDDTAKYPTFHIGNPAKDPESFFGLICNCHWCCCAPRRPAFLPGSKYTPQKYDRKSRFEAGVDLEKCTGCKICVEKRCQFGGAQMKFYPEYGKEKAYVDVELCMGCGNCVETCPTGARTFKLVRPPEWITEGPQKRTYQQRSLG